MIKQENKGIWQYAKFLPSIPKKYQLTLAEGNTTLKKIDDIYFKCEYENPTGSVKDRGLAYQISSLFSKGIKEAVISSSGNAAISAAKYCQMANIILTVFVSPKINKSKLDELEKLAIKIIQSSRPISDAFKYSKEKNIYNLRPSRDPVGHIGYSTIAYELDQEVGKVDAIFFPVSSGTTLVGVAQGYKKLGYIPKLFVVQTTAVHPIASQFDSDFKKTLTSLANSLAAKYSPREKEIAKIIKKSHGGGWVISDEEMIAARNWLLGHNIDCSYEGAATLAALWKAHKKGSVFRNPVCLLTGKFY